VIVDDGSIPPVSEERVREVLGDKYRIIRHEQAKGIGAAKNAGVCGARGDVVLHLDDDDVLASTALESIAQAYHLVPELDCLFVGVEPFGRYALGSAKNQQAALARVLERSPGTVKGEVIVFGDNLFDTLLRSVPFAFQRPAARRETWNRVGLLRETSYFPEPEWAQKAALQCCGALYISPLYCCRMDGQNLVSSTANKQRHIEASIDVKRSLVEYIDSRKEQFGNRLAAARSSLAQAYFDKAYHYYWHGRRFIAWPALYEAFRIAPNAAQLKLALRTLLPRVGRNDDRTGE